MCHFAPEWLPRLTCLKNTPKYSGAFWRTVLALIGNVAPPRVPARFRLCGILAHILAHTFSRRFLIETCFGANASASYLIKAFLGMLVFPVFPGTCRSAWPPPIFWRTLFSRRISLILSMSCFRQLSREMIKQVRSSKLTLRQTHVSINTQVYFPEPSEMEQYKYQQTYCREVDSHTVALTLRVQNLILIPATWAGWTYPFQDGMRFLVRWSLNVLKTSLVSQVWLAGSMTSGHSRTHGLFLQACCTASLGLVWVSLAIPARAALHQKGWLGSAAYPCNLARNEDIPANGPWFWCRGL